MRYYTQRPRRTSSKTLLRPEDHDAEDARCEEEDRESIEESLRYLQYLTEHDAQLTDSVRRLTCYQLHDALITHVEEGANSVALLLDTTGAPWLRDTSAQIIFLGVQEAIGLEGLIRQTILHQEVYVHDDGNFEFGAMCSRTEFHLRFADVEIHPAGQKVRKPYRP